MRFDERSDPPALDDPPREWRGARKSEQELARHELHLLLLQVPRHAPHCDLHGPLLDEFA
jgi:hypothetical protein